uniref:Protein rogdi n=1 Tax=Meloidogyne incognita TaxID=6306 RepID=A0A914MIV1_MELIC
MINNGEEECSYSSSDESSQVVPLENRLQLESEWFQKARASSTIEQLRYLLADCCRRLNAQHKCSDPTLASEPRAKPSTERFQLSSKVVPPQESNLTALVILAGDSVVQAEVSLKYAKSASGFYRATAQPDVHWKIQQLQDAANTIVRALGSLYRGQRLYAEAIQKGSDTSQLLLQIFQSVKNDIKLSRSSLTTPKKKSLTELCNFHPIKSFVPPLPHDILLSFYLSSAKLICAAYQVAQKEGTQTVTVFQAECQMPKIVELIQQLNVAFAVVHDFLANFNLLIDAKK